MFPFHERTMPSGSLDPSDCAECIAEVIMCGMEAYVPFSFPISSSSYQPWFDEACSESISIRNRAHHLWKTNQTPYSHSKFISALNCAHSIIKNLKQNFIKKKSDYLSNNPSLLILVTRKANYSKFH